MSKLLTTPVGTINFIAHKTARFNQMKNRTEFSARIEIDGDTKGAQEFKDTLRNINSSLGSEKKVAKKGNYFVNAASKDAPKILDKKGKVLTADEIPDIEGGTVRLVLQPFQSKVKGMEGGVGLVAIQLVDIIEYTGGATIDDEELQSALDDLDLS